MVDLYSMKQAYQRHLSVTIKKLHKYFQLISAVSVDQCKKKSNKF